MIEKAIPPETRRVKSLEGLVSLLGEEVKPFVGQQIPENFINILTQPRKTFLEIKELAENIAHNGLLHPLLVARFNRENCKQYLGFINSLWKTNYKTSDLLGLNEGDEEVFYILISGERRLRAIRHLLTEGCGCEECQTKHSDENCYEYHFGDRSVAVRLASNPSPLQAIFVQASENIHMRVPSHEEARFYYRALLRMRELDENLPLSRFARWVGRTSEYIRDAVRFCELPSNIQEYVEEGYMPYGKAIEIARLREGGLKAGLGEEDLNLDWWTKRAVLERSTVEEFRRGVKGFLRGLNSGQTMFEIFREAEKKGILRASMRQVVAKNTIMALWGWAHYFRTVRRLVVEGKLGEKDSPFSVRSPIRFLSAVVSELEQVLPTLRHHLSKEKYGKAQEVVSETAQVTAELQQYLPEQDDINPHSDFLSRGGNFS